MRLDAGIINAVMSCRNDNTGSLPVFGDINRQRLILACRTLSAR